MFGNTISNFGLQTATNVYSRVNIDTMVSPGVYNTVFTDTVQFGTILSDSNAFAVKPITDTSWLAIGEYRYQYIIYQDSVDASPSSDTITDFFNITDNYWSRVERQASGFPFGSGATLAGTTTYIDAFEWGSMYFFPNGANVKIDTFFTTFYSHPSATAINAPYQLKIHEVNIQGTQFDLTTDLTTVGLAFDTVAVTAGSATYGTISTVFDASVGTPQNFRFKDYKLYYISIYQENAVAPYLSDGTVRNGLYMYFHDDNDDFTVYSNSNNFPFYSPLRITEQGVTSDYSYGYSGSLDPSIGFVLSSTITDVASEERTELQGVTVSPNPTTDLLNVNVSLENSADVQYILTDVSGRIIHVEKSFNVSNEVKTFDVSKYPAGVFLLNVVTADGFTSKRIIKR
jgi:hypothetical protein